MLKLFAALCLLLLSLLFAVPAHSQKAPPLTPDQMTGYRMLSAASAFGALLRCAQYEERFRPRLQGQYDGIGMKLKELLAMDEPSAEKLHQVMRAMLKQGTSGIYTRITFVKGDVKVEQITVDVSEVCQKVSDELDDMLTGPLSVKTGRDKTGDL